MENFGSCSAMRPSIKRPATKSPGPARRFFATFRTMPTSSGSLRMRSKQSVGFPACVRSVLVYLFDRDEGAKNAVAQVIREAGGKVVFQSPRGFYLAANVPLDRLA